MPQNWSTFSMVSYQRVIGLPVSSDLHFPDIHVDHRVLVFVITEGSHGTIEGDLSGGCQEERQVSSTFPFNSLNGLSPMP